MFVRWMRICACSWLFWSAAAAASDPIPRLALQGEPGANIILARIDPEATPIRIDGLIDEAVWQQAPGHR